MGQTRMRGRLFMSRLTSRALPWCKYIQTTKGFQTKSESVLAFKLKANVPRVVWVLDFIRNDYFPQQLMTNTPV